MKRFFHFSVLYMVFAIGVTALVRPMNMDVAVNSVAATVAFLMLIANGAKWVLPIFVCVPLVLGWRRFFRSLGGVGYAIAASALMHTAFSFVKSSIPLIVPFYADPPLAAFDKWLHGGTDPWVFAFEWTSSLPMQDILPLYMSVWIIPALSLPLFMAVTDHDRERTARFLVLYCVGWLVLGNVVALAGASVGPVYYDALLGGDRFAGLQAALADIGIAETRIGHVQAYLWRAYAERNMALGSGLSAFPSLHVCIATITALYFAERSRWLILPGAVFLAFIQLLSVYTGYHYAVDGYFSILFIVALWAVLRRVRLTEPGALKGLLRPRTQKDMIGARSL